MMLPYPIRTYRGPPMPFNQPRQSFSRMCRIMLDLE